MAGKFVITKGKDDKYYFNLKAGNGEVVLTSQGYKAKADCMNGIESDGLAHPDTEYGVTEQTRSGAAPPGGPTRECARIRVRLCA